MEGRRCEQQGMEGEWGWVTANQGYEIEKSKTGQHIQYIRHAGPEEVKDKYSERWGK